MSPRIDPAVRPILVVEDSEEDYDTVLEATRRGGFPNRVVRAASAEEAQRLLPADGTSAEPFAFVLLDQNLPGLSGVDFLRGLRGSSAHRTVPVVVYTTSTNPRDRDVCYDAGANAYHVKAVQFDQCLQTLSEVFDYWLRWTVLPEAPAAAETARR